MIKVILLYEKRIKEGRVSALEMLELMCYLRHERLIHLLVTIATGLFWIFTMFLMLKIPCIFTSIIFLIITVLFMLYIHYYCHLERHVQRLSNATLKLLENEEEL